MAPPGAGTGAGAGAGAGVLGGTSVAPMAPFTPPVNARQVVICGTALSGSDSNDTLAGKLQTATGMFMSTDKYVSKRVMAVIVRGGKGAADLAKAALKPAAVANALRRTPKVPVVDEQQLPQLLLALQLISSAQSAAAKAVLEASSAAAGAAAARREDGLAFVNIYGVLANGPHGTRLIGNKVLLQSKLSAIFSAANTAYTQMAKEAPQERNSGSEGRTHHVYRAEHAHALYTALLAQGLLADA